jgi:hypothetical protein
MLWKEACNARMSRKRLWEYQIGTCLRAKLPDLAGLTKDQFLRLLYPLKSVFMNVEACSCQPEVFGGGGIIPAMIVISQEVVPAHVKVGLLNRGCSVAIPPTEPKPPAYLLGELGDIRSHPAHMIPRDSHRLTANEGAMLGILFPDVLEYRSLHLMSDWGLVSLNNERVLTNRVLRCEGCDHRNHWDYPNNWADFFARDVK